jgi:hypothetical protein
MKKSMDQGDGNESAAVERMRQNARISSDIFADRLRYFVHRWAPQAHERDDFQRDLMHLFTDAMRNQSDHLELGIETYASTMWRAGSLSPLHTIFESPTKTDR